MTSSPSGSAAALISRTRIRLDGMAYLTPLAP
jgi:hypothetical protein